MLQGRLSTVAAPVLVVLLGIAGCSSPGSGPSDGAPPPGRTVTDGPVPIATLDIVTATEPLDADQLYDGFDQNQIDSVGGESCARELAAIIAAGENHLARTGRQPADIAELVEAGYLPGTPERWRLVGDELLPTPEGGCASPG